jgi:hypothetical protein
MALALHRDRCRRQRAVQARGELLSHLELGDQGELLAAPADVDRQRQAFCRQRRAISTSCGSPVSSRIPSGGSAAGSRAQPRLDQADTPRCFGRLERQRDLHVEAGARAIQIGRLLHQPRHVR